jgi:hypothetical protein
MRDGNETYLNFLVVTKGIHELLLERLSDPD